MSIGQSGICEVQGMYKNIIIGGFLEIGINGGGGQNKNSEGKLRGGGEGGAVVFFYLAIL